MTTPNANTVYGTSLSVAVNGGAAANGGALYGFGFGTFYDDQADPDGYDTDAASAAYSAFQSNVNAQPTPVPQLLQQVIETLDDPAATTIYGTTFNGGWDVIDPILVSLGLINAPS